MKYSAPSLIVMAILAPLLVVGMAIVSVAAFDFINDPVPWPDGGSPYKPLLPHLLGPIWVSLLAAWVILGAVVGKLAGQFKGEVIGALVGLVLALVSLPVLLAAASLLVPGAVGFP